MVLWMLFLTTIPSIVITQLQSLLIVKLWLFKSLLCRIGLFLLEKTKDFWILQFSWQTFNWALLSAHPVLNQDPLRKSKIRKSLFLATLEIRLLRNKWRIIRLSSGCHNMTGAELSDIILELFWEVFTSRYPNACTARTWSDNKFQLL